MARHQINFRLPGAEYAALKSEADRLGIPVATAARLRLAESLSIEPRLAAIEQRLAAMPTGEQTLVALRHLAAKIDHAAGAQGGAK